jgi:hypothetical protein
MRIFECQNCGQPLYFENRRCESCGLALGYLPEHSVISALEPIDSGLWRALAAPEQGFKFCLNAQFDVCNWMVAADQHEGFCIACRHNRIIPDLSFPEFGQRWRRIEVAKHRLIYTLLRLRLPLVTKTEDPNGLAFDFLAAAPPGMMSHSPVMTGHEHGLITLNLAEADDSEREKLRSHMGEPYRTLLGHFRHEIAHYYWDQIIQDSPAIPQFRALFGDERNDYGQALQAHYNNGAPSNWPENFVSAYASSHPWEDFAETWAHYFHMVDTLETASAFGMRLRPKTSTGADLSTIIDFDPYAADMDRIVDAWLPLTYAVNSINRSMGLQDLYPFIVGPAVIMKLAFIHDLIRAVSTQGAEAVHKGGLRAVIAGLRRSVGAPH